MSPQHPANPDAVDALICILFAVGSIALACFWAMLIVWLRSWRDRIAQPQWLLTPRKFRL